MITVENDKNYENDGNDGNGGNCGNSANNGNDESSHTQLSSIVHKKELKMRWRLVCISIEKDNISFDLAMLLANVSEISAKKELIYKDQRPTTIYMTGNKLK